MPNWTDNTVEITGSSEALKELREVITNEDDTISLTNVNDTPDIFKGIHSGSRTIDNKRYKLWREDKEGNPTGVTEEEYSKILKLTGAMDSIDWQYKNWGTKWGDCNTEILKETETTLVLNFESAWGEPFLLLDDIANKYSLTIKNVWDVEFDNAGLSNYPMPILQRAELDNTWAKSLDAQRVAIDKAAVEIIVEEE